MFDLLTLTCLIFEAHANDTLQIRDSWLTKVFRAALICVLCQSISTNSWHLMGAWLIDFNEASIQGKQLWVLLRN